METEPDIELLRSCPAGAERQRELARLFTLHRPRLSRFVDLRLDPRCRRRIGSSDVIQQAYLAASRKLDGYLANVHLPLGLWLRRIAADAVFDAHRLHLGAGRRDARREAHGEPEAQSGPLSDVLEKSVIAPGDSPSEAAARAETRRAIRRVLEQLDPGDREVIALRSFEGLSSAECALVLGVSTEAVKKRYLRALVRFKAEYDRSTGPA